jgi:hypothetical protein
MKILLLDIARFSLERIVTLTALDEHISSHDSNGYTIREYVQKRCLAGTGFALYNLYQQA